MDAGRGQDRLTIVEQPPRPPTTFYPTSMDSLNPQQQHHQQLRAGTGYGDLCRVQGPTDALSAAYHSRYLASLPALSSASGSSFPFLSSMFASGPTSPFRAPSAPGVSSCGTNGTTNPMRQQLFWPPTPPPDGYGRYGLNTSLFPLFGSVSPSPTDGGAAAAAYMLSQGLVSRHLTPCTTTASSSHHLLDAHKGNYDQGFFSPGFGLGSPLTPSSQLTATNPFSHHLIPPPHPLDYNKYPNFIPAPGLNSAGTKDFLATVTDDSKPQPHHHHHHHHSTNCQLAVKSENSNSPSTTSISSNVTSIKHSHPPVTTSSKSSRSERKSSSYSPGRSKDTRHNEDVKPQAKNQDESINKHYQQSRHLQHYFPPSGIKSCSPFEIDVTCGPTIKPDILSPPIETTSDAALPGSPYQDKKKGLSTPGESRCLSCANDVFQKKDIPKVEEEEDEDESNVVVIVDNDDKVSRSSPKNESADDAVPHDSSTTVMTKSDDVRSDDRSDSPKNDVPPVPNSVFPTFDKSDNNFPVTNTRTDNVLNSVSSKHVTAAVIPTAPKQQHLSNYHLSRVDNLNSTMSRQTSGSESDAKGTCRTSSDSPKTTLSALSKIKSETTESAESTLPATAYHQNSSSNFCRHLNSKASCTKVKDMIMSIDSSSKQTSSSQSQVAVVDGHQTASSSMDKTFRTASPSVMKLCPVIPEKTVQGKVQAMTVDSKKRIVGPLKAESPVYRFDSFNSDLSQKQHLANWSKATVSPYSWQQKEEDQQAMNLTVCKKKLESFSPVPSTENNNADVVNSIDTMTTISTAPNTPKTPFTVENIMSTSNTTTTSCCLSGTGVIGVCHPNVSKGKVFTVGGSVSKFSAMTSVTSQMDVGNDGEVHLSSHSVHATKSSTFQTLNAAAAACLNRAASVTGFQNTKTQLKTERLTPHVRSKGKDNEKIISTGGRATTLATLAPKLNKKLGFLKDGKSSHTLSTSSSVSSTSIVFPATVNSCIPVGIAIAQQRQDSSTAATLGKNHSSVGPISTGIAPPTTPLTNNRIPTEIQHSQEFLRDQKPQDISCPNSAVSSDSTNFLVTQGPTIVSRQWESEAVTRATLPSPWVAQGPIVAPALWIGQGATTAAAYAATPASTPQIPAPVPTPVNPLETPPISLPPGGYQLARDSVTGHLFLIPAANIVDRTAMWPSYNTSTGSTLPIQQLVTQQHHTQFEQVLPQVPEQEHLQDCLALSVQQTHIGESGKDLRTIDSCCDVPGSYKATELQEIKTEDKESSSHVPSVPLASGQTFTFTTFPTPCDPSGFSYVLQSSTVMHLAHTAQTTSIQTDSGKRSQGTSPLHPATPSPSPSLPMSSTLLMSENDDEEEEPQDSDCDGVTSGESNQMKMSQQAQSVTTAVQVDMDSRTNSEEEEEELDEEDEIKSTLIDSEQVKMSDSANQTENVLSDSGKGDSETELSVEEIAHETKKAAVIQALTHSANESFAPSTEVIDINKMSNDSPSNDIVVAEDGEIAPSLPVESKPVMDFIDHHGLDLLVDSIEEFASRERQETREEERQQESTLNQPRCLETKEPTLSEEVFSAPASSYGNLDTSSCTDGLGLLCALAEQRFLEEVCNTDGPLEKPKVEKPTYDCYSFLDEEGSHNVNTKYCSPKRDTNLHKNISSSPSFQQILDAPVDDLPSSNLQACEKEMRKRLADLQRKYKKKQLQLAKLMPNGESDEEDDDDDDDDPAIEIEDKTTDASPPPPPPTPSPPPHLPSKKTFSLPHFKHKASGKSNNRFHPHSYKTMAQRLTNSRANLSSNFQKRSRKNEISRHVKSSLNHSKETPSSSLVERQSETKVKKQSKENVENSRDQNKSSSLDKAKVTKKVEKNVQKESLSKSSASSNDKSPSLKISHKTKTSFSQKFSVDAKNKTSQDSTKPVIKSKPGDTSKSLKMSNKSLHGTLKHQIDISHNRTSSENTLKRKAVKDEPKHIKKVKIEKVQSHHFESKNSDHEEPPETKKSKMHQSSSHDDSKDKEKNKVPFFDEQAWFVRRSERIFLSDARPPPVQQSTSNNTLSNNNTPKKANPQHSNASQKMESGLKDKKENSVKAPAKVSDVKLTTAVKSEKDKEQSCKPIKNKLITKPKTKLPDQTVLSKKRCISSSSSKSSETSSSVDSDSSDDSSSHSDNLSHITVNQPSPATVSTEVKAKKTENDHLNLTQQKELVSANSTQGSIKSCILDPKLEDNTRVLVLEDSLFYAGHIIGIEAPDVYGIILDGKRTHRPRIFSREEILNAAVLEVKPTETAQLPEGSRVCAYWSQQYRCLYPGTVAKASSPLPDPSLLFVEFDDGDSGRIPLDDIRMLPPDFPIVSIEEENSYLLFGKRKSRNDKDNSSEQQQKCQNRTSLQKFETKQIKDSPKIKKKREDSADGKRSRDCSKSERQSPSNRKSPTENQNTPSKHHNVLVSATTSDKVKSKKLKIKDEGSKKKKVRSRESSLDVQLKAKKRKKHREEHKHHHKHKHHHHKHHHKKHKQIAESPDDSSQETSKVGSLYSPSHEGELMILTAEKTSDLTVTIKTSPSPHTAANHAKHTELVANEKTERENTSSKQPLEESKPKSKINKKKKISCETKPAKRKERVPSVEKSKIAAFLPVRQLWRWSGKGFRRPGAKGKGKKEFFRAIQRGKELLRVGDCAVFLSTGRPHLPYIGRIETMWESWGGKMDVRVKWFYHPEETKSSKKLTHLKGALFQSPHFDENDVQTISHKCEVLSWDDYQERKDQDMGKNESSFFDNNDTYYLAGTYDPITGNLVMEPGVPKFNPSEN